MSQLLGRRGRVRLSAHAGFAAFLAARLLSAEPGERPAERPSEISNLLELWEDDGASPDDAKIERWGSETGWRPARRLLDAARHSGVVENPRLGLQMVRALHRHSSGPLRDEVVALLEEFFQPSTAASQSSTGPSASNGAFRHLVRGTAALALASSQHPRALRLLVVAARTESETDPASTLLARAALQAHPPGKAAQRSLMFLKLEADPGQVERDAKAAAPPRLDAGEWPSASNPQRGFALLLRVLEAAKTHDELDESSAWKAAFQGEPNPWVLRTLTLLSLRVKSLRPLLLSQARSHLRDRSANVRAAAAFAIAVHDPNEALALLDDKDAAVRAAVMRQAHSGMLAQSARALLQRELRKRPAPSMSALTVGLEPSLNASEMPTRLLWLGLAHFAEDAPWKAALAGRAISENEATAGPDAMELVTWLADESPEGRIAVAFGLGFSNHRAAPGLLVRAYRSEATAEVRRAIVAALSKKVGPGVQRQLQEVRELDPDALCRWAATLGAARHDAIGSYALGLLGGAAVPMGQGNSRLTQWSTVWGRPLVLEPDADGFIAVAGLDFFACSEGATPALATGADCRKAVAPEHGK